MAVVSRKDLLELLESWRLGRTTAKSVQAWAEARYQVDEWESEDLVVNEILARLDGLDMNLITADDIPVFTVALGSPPSSKDGVDALTRNLEAVDVESRKKALRSDPLYAPFCE